jgi:circadian clock protein KaiB
MPTLPTSENYILRLYITGANHHSMMAVKNIKTICEAYLPGAYTLEIIDVYQQPQLAGSEDIIAAPTLVKLQPAPRRKLIGDLSDTGRVLAALDLSGAAGYGAGPSA